MTTIAAAGIYYASAHYGSEPAGGIAAAAGCLAGILLTPDLDLDRPTRSHYVVRRGLGRGPYLLWRAFWSPYGWAIEHRSWLSHAPVISTIFRLLYVLSIPAILVVGLAALGYTWSWRAWLAYRFEIQAAIAGLMVSDILHWAADSIFSTLKRRLHGRRRRFIQ